MGKMCFFRVSLEPDEFQTAQGIENELFRVQEEAEESAEVEEYHLQAGSVEEVSDKETEIPMCLASFPKMKL